LSEATLTVLARVAEASNATLVAMATHPDGSLPCVYKPTVGERPLWDFPPGTLARREVASYRLSRALDWGLVPPTVLREGPLGPGSVQAWVGDTTADGTPTAVDPGAGLVDLFAPEGVPDGWFTVLAGNDETDRPVVLAHADHPQLRRTAVLDVVLTNADRKAGHLLTDPFGRLRGIDHGLTFHVRDKLRTVLWGWSGRRLPAEVLDDLLRLPTDLTGTTGLRQDLAALLTPAEIDATVARTESLLRSGRHPTPRPGYPPVPWPVF
jgi:uncharacterized repeat protein (TIGR03843 family)